MSYEQILYEVAGHIATITLHRPDKLNAWTLSMDNEVRSAMSEADRDPDVRVVIFTGAGRGFCAGADMKLLQSVMAGQGVSHAGAHVPTPRELWPSARKDFQQHYSYFPAVSKPVIGAINGVAAGLGFVLTLYCDMRFASESATFTTAFARRGLIAEHGVAWLLPRLIGQSHALDLLLSARTIDAQEALRMGLVNRVVSADRLMEETRAYATEIATLSSPRSHRVIKKQVYDSLFEPLVESLQTADVEMMQSFTGDDFREGVAHFLERRPPKFTGK